MPKHRFQVTYGSGDRRLHGVAGPVRHLHHALGGDQSRSGLLRRRGSSTPQSDQVPHLHRIQRHGRSRKSSPGGGMPGNATKDSTRTGRSKSWSVARPTHCCTTSRSSAPRSVRTKGIVIFSPRSSLRRRAQSHSIRNANRHALAREADLSERESRRATVQAANQPLHASSACSRSPGERKPKGSPARMSRTRRRPDATVARATGRSGAVLWNMGVGEDGVDALDVREGGVGQGLVEVRAMSITDGFAEPWPSVSC